MSTALCLLDVKAYPIMCRYCYSWNIL